MKILNNFFVTTTNTVEGIKIKQYLKPISAHIVTGTNLFSDFFAGLSDVFGGRSETYQRQLSSIYAEAIEHLKQSAVEIGANAIIGMKVDIDEISGKGKSMFMITATGTAVILENVETISKTQTQEKLAVISIEKMEELRKRKEIIQMAKNNKFVTTEAGYQICIDGMDIIWDFITSNSVYEVAGEMLDLPIFDTSSIHYPQLLTYLSSLDADFTVNFMYQYIMSEKADSKTKMLYGLMQDLKIFDVEKLLLYLQSDNEEYRKMALQLVVIDKQIYTQDDIADFERIIQLIQSTFKEKVTYSTSKGLLSKEKKVWICKCGTKNDIDVEYCKSELCKKDKYGYNRDEVNPVKAIKKLEENIELIKAYYFQ